MRVCHRQSLWGQRGRYRPRVSCHIPGKCYIRPVASAWLGNTTVHTFRTMRLADYTMFGSGSTTVYTCRTMHLADYTMFWLGSTTVVYKLRTMRLEDSTMFWLGSTTVYTSRTTRLADNTIRSGNTLKSVTDRLYSKLALHSDCIRVYRSHNSVLLCSTLITVMCLYSNCTRRRRAFIPFSRTSARLPMDLNSMELVARPCPSAPFNSSKATGTPTKQVRYMEREATGGQYQSQRCKTERGVKLFHVPLFIARLFAVGTVDDKEY